MSRGARQFDGFGVGSAHAGVIGQILGAALGVRIGLDLLEDSLDVSIDGDVDALTAFDDAGGEGVEPAGELGLSRTGKG